MGTADVFSRLSSSTTFEATHSLSLSLLLFRNNIKPSLSRSQYAIHKLRHLRVLDFSKVKPGEREAADKAFAEAEGGAAAAAARTFDPGEAVGAAGPSSSAAAGAEKATEAPSAAKLAALRAALEGAATLEEVAAIEAQLANGGANGGDTEGDKDMDQG